METGLNINPLTDFSAGNSSAAVEPETIESNGSFQEVLAEQSAGYQVDDKKNQEVEEGELGLEIEPVATVDLLPDLQFKDLFPVATDSTLTADSGQTLPLNLNLSNEELNPVPNINDDGVINVTMDESDNEIVIAAADMANLMTLNQTSVPVPAMQPTTVVELPIQVKEQYSQSMMNDDPEISMTSSLATMTKKSPNVMNSIASAMEFVASDVTPVTQATFEFASLAVPSSPISNQITSLQTLQLPSMASIPTGEISLSIDQPNWNSALGEHLVMMARGDQQFASLALDPPELGPLVIQMNINNKQADISFVSGHAVIRDMISQSITELREVLQGDGITLGGYQVSDFNRGNGDQAQAQYQTEQSFFGRYAESNHETEGQEVIRIPLRDSGLVDFYI